MKPIVSEAQSKYLDKITFELYDITKGENDPIATKYKVYLTPTFVIVDDQQKEIDRLIGEVPKATLDKFISGNVEKHGKSN